MRIEQIGDDIQISGLTHFDILKIFNCGQSFRFSIQANEVTGVAFGKILKLLQHLDIVVIKNCSLEVFNCIWRGYLSCDTDYENIIKLIDNDEIIHSAIEFGGGIRILKQDLWESIISFILSQNSNIPRIKKMVASLCSECGKEIDDTGYFSFPEPEEILSYGPQALSKLKLGYRDEYVYEISKAVIEEILNLNELNNLDTQSARKKLMSFKGIGGKVADCILLFGMGRYEVCPHDVWVKRILSEKYDIIKITEDKGYKFVTEKWGCYAGIAQQFLFYSYRR